MAVTISSKVFNDVLNLPGMEEKLRKTFSEVPRVMTPEEFDIHWDEFFKVITGEKKKVGKAEVDKTS